MAEVDATTIVVALLGGGAVSGIAAWYRAGSEHETTMVQRALEIVDRQKAEIADQHAQLVELRARSEQTDRELERERALRRSLERRVETLEWELKLSRSPPHPGD